VIGGDTYTAYSGLLAAMMSNTLAPAASVRPGETLEASVQSLWGAGLYVMNSCNGAPANCLSGEYFKDSELDPTVRVVFSQLTNHFLVIDGASEN